MKIIFYLAFAAINLLLILRIPDGAAKMKYLKFLGWGIPITFVTAILVMLAMKIIGMRPDDPFKNIFFGIILSILTILLTNIIIIAADHIIDMQLKFHTTCNAVNSDRFPVRFLVKNEQVIRNGVRVIFFLGSLLMLYGIWLRKR